MSTWTKDKPTIVGAYWLSLAPDRRLKMRPVIRCSVYSSPHDAPGLLRVHIKDSDNMALSDFRAIDEPCFTGAQWKRVEGVPSDPFAETQPRYSQDDDLP